ncbi:MAG TPA: MFS transporter, partial [Candidatus Methylacidiphilales bacterium]
MTPTPPEAPSPPETNATTPKTYRIGTLAYTRRGLAVLFLWLLWGDFAFTFFENIFGRFVPLYLKDLHASNTLIGVMTGSFAGLVNILFLPNISQWSDRTRTRWGRRIPFLYVVTPLTVGSLVAVGFAPEIAQGIHRHLLAALSPGLAERSVLLILLCGFIVSFHFHNMVLVNSYNWLLRDVVPLELMARFLSWFRVVGTVSSFAFLWWVFPHILTHRKAVFLGVGLFYLAAFLLMCRNVREGSHPPSPPRASRPGLPATFALYFRECLRFPIYRNFFLVYVLAIGATSCAGPFSVLFTRDTLGIGMEQMGRIFAWSAAASLLALFPMGWLCDRFSPLKVTLASLCGLAAASFLALFLVRDARGYFVYSLAWSLPTVAWSLGSLAATMRLFPAAKFGQFSSGLNVFGCGALIVGNYLMGKFIDLAHGDYQMTFLWSAALFTLAVGPMLLVHRDWKRRGGPDRYV